jgi:hypothetical protein
MHLAAALLLNTEMVSGVRNKKQDILTAKATVSFLSTTFLHACHYRGNSMGR